MASFFCSECLADTLGPGSIRSDHCPCDDACAANNERVHMHNPLAGSAYHVGWVVMLLQSGLHHIMHQQIISVHHTVQRLVVHRDAGEHKFIPLTKLQLLQDRQIFGSYTCPFLTRSSRSP